MPLLHPDAVAAACAAVADAQRTLCEGRLPLCRWPALRKLLAPPWLAVLINDEAGRYVEAWALASGPAPGLRPVTPDDAALLAALWLRLRRPEEVASSGHWGVGMLPAAEVHVALPARFVRRMVPAPGRHA